MMAMMKKSEAVEMAEKALERPRDFAYYGDNYDLFETWGFTFGRSRDSDLIEESNFHEILKRLRAINEDHVNVERSNHWAVGWVEQISVKVLNKHKEEGEPITEEDLTEVFWGVINIKESLAGYAILNEEDYTQREHDEFLEELEHFYGVPEEALDDVARRLWEVDNICTPDELTDEAVAEAREYLLVDVHHVCTNLSIPLVEDAPVDDEAGDWTLAPLDYVFRTKFEATQDYCGHHMAAAVLGPKGTLLLYVELNPKTL